ncbi:hypothetical protein B566_EDAN004941 [Ephemera danica]|nr:hypothetical protein B566_EDAN004941 [Ephemera danica]
MTWPQTDVATGASRNRLNCRGECNIGGGLLLTVLGVVLVLCSLMESSSCAFRGDHRLLSPNVTRLLNDLLATDRYDKRIRPDFGGNPVRISVNMYIKSMGPVSETDEWYSMDCYFRQRWYDGRLRFNLTGLKEFSMNWLTIKASCKMHLRKFPFDSQICPLLIGSYGYSSSDVLYQWHGDEPVGLEEGVNLAQYDLVDVSTETMQDPPEQAMIRREDFSVIKVKFHLKRHTGYFMLQVYVPCGLIVSCSWVSFWIDPDAVPARVSLGVTTVLSMTTMGFGGRSQLPKVSYRTALDWFVILCFSFVFAVMVEYAAINFIDTLTTELKRIIEERRKAAAAAAQAQREKGPEDTSLETVNWSPETSRGLQEALLQPSCTSDAEDELLARQHAARGEADSPDEVGEEDGLVRPALVTVTLATAMAVATMAGAGLKPPTPPFKDVGADRSPGSESSSEEDEDEERDPDKWDGPPIPTIVIDTVEDLELESLGETPVPPLRGATLPVSARCLDWIVTRLRKWRAFHFLPREEDVKMMTEPKEKFSRIDRESRKIFPFLFAVFISIYWFVYMYYMTDEIGQSDATPSAVSKPRS